MSSLQVASRQNAFSSLNRNGEPGKKPQDKIKFYVSKNKPPSKTPKSHLPKLIPTRRQPFDRNSSRTLNDNDLLHLSIKGVNKNASKNCSKKCAKNGEKAAKTSSNDPTKSSIRSSKPVLFKLGVPLCSVQSTTALQNVPKKTEIQDPCKQGSSNSKSLYKMPDIFKEQTLKSSPKVSYAPDGDEVKESLPKILETNEKNLLFSGKDIDPELEDLVFYSVRGAELLKMDKLTSFEKLQSELKCVKEKMFNQKARDRNLRRFRDKSLKGKVLNLVKSVNETCEEQNEYSKNENATRPIEKRELTASHCSAPQYSNCLSPSKTKRQQIYLDKLKTHIESLDIDYVEQGVNYLKCNKKEGERDDKLQMGYDASQTPWQRCKDIFVPKAMQLILPCRERSLAGNYCFFPRRLDGNSRESRDFKSFLKYDTGTTGSYYYKLKESIEERSREMYYSRPSSIDKARIPINEPEVSSRIPDIYDNVRYSRLLKYRFNEIVKSEKCRLKAKEMYGRRMAFESMQCEESLLSEDKVSSTVHSMEKEMNITVGKTSDFPLFKYSMLPVEETVRCQTASAMDSKAELMDDPFPKKDCLNER